MICFMMNPISGGVGDDIVACNAIRSLIAQVTFRVFLCVLDMEYDEINLDCTFTYSIAIQFDFDAFHRYP